MALALLQTLTAAGCMPRDVADRRPNFIVVFCGNLGYGDVEIFGSRTIRTLYINRLARRDLQSTSLYAQPVCGPTRAEG